MKDWITNVITRELKALRREIDNAIAAVELGMSKIKEEDLSKPFPEKIGGVSSSTGAFLAHFATHLAYHLGQVDYHRRMLTGESKTVKAMALNELDGQPA